MSRSRIRLDLVLDHGDSRDDRTWRLRTDGTEVGRLHAVHLGDDVTIDVRVDPEQRRRGIARVAVGRLLGMAPWGADVRYVAAFDPADAAADALAQALGFRREGDGPDGRGLWVRAAPRPRAAADDVTRFLDASGRIDRYPLRGGDRRELLAWVAGRALPEGVVLDEKRVNELLTPYAPGGDVAVLRRYLVDHGLVSRTASGSAYLREG